MAKQVGKNIAFEITKDNKLQITVDLTKTNGKSKSGKTIVIGTTEGNAKALDKNEDEFMFGVNVYKYPSE